MEDVKKIIEIDKMLEIVLTGKVEHLQEARRAKWMLDVYLEDKNVEVWKYTLDEE
ncbi:MAG: hypothetical protein GX053_12790 [Tissierella sp.]|nr:hypothetical protein [Tissierella sp.]